MKEPNEKDALERTRKPSLSQEVSRRQVDDLRQTIRRGSMDQFAFQTMIGSFYDL